MSEDKFERLGPMLSEVGAEAAVIAGGKTDGLYLYAEVEEGSVAASVFVDEGDIVRYYDPTQELFNLIREAWEESEPDEAKRWIVMEYEVRGTTFDVKVRYREELDPEDYVMDRRRAALKARYGDKPVIYPPMPEHMRGNS
jgi:hypothetical protein